MDGIGYSSLGMNLDAVLGAFPRTLLSHPAGTARAARSALREAWRDLLDLDFDRVSVSLLEVERQTSRLPVAVTAELRREVRLLHAAALILQDNVLAALPIAAVVLKEHTTGRCASIARLLCRLGHWRLGDAAGYCTLPHAVLSRGKRRGSIASLEMAIEAAIAFEQLNLGAARRLALEAMAMAETPGFARLAQPAIVAAQVAYEQGCLEEVEDLLGSRVGSIKAQGDLESVLRAHILLSRTAARRGTRDLTFARLREAEAIGVRRRWPRLVAASVAEQVARLIEDGRLDEAEACIGRAPGGPGSIGIAEDLGLARARIAIARGQPMDALGALRLLREAALARQDRHAALGISLVLIDALAQLGRQSEAARMLLPLLTVGYTTGVYQSFVDAGPQMGSILTVAYQLACESESTPAELLTYIDSLFVRWRPHVGAKTITPAARKTASLSPREREIHRFLGRGLSNKAIARELDIHPETVKSHVKRIFAKIEVKTRAEAVARPDV